MFKHELYKLLCNRVSVAVIAVMLVVNVLQLVWLEDNRHDYPASAYNRLWEDMEEAASTGGTWQGVLSGFKEEYATMQKVHIMEADSYHAEYTGHLIYEKDLYERVIAEVESALGYADYLAGIEATRARFEAMGGLVERDNYVYRNLVKSAELYAELEAIELTPAPSAGVVMAVGSDVTDFLGIVLFLFFGITVWLKEKEQGVLVLLRTAKNGRYKLAAAKMAAFAVACILCGTLLYVSNIAAAAVTYGLGDITRPLASVSEYRGTLWRISAGEFLLLNLVVKLVVYVWLSLLISVICTGVHSSVAAFGSMALISAGGWIMYTVIPSLSAWAVLKYLNPFGIIKTHLVFQEFRGLNILGYPFDYRKCVAVVIMMGAILFVFFSAKFFVRTPLGRGVRIPAFVGRLSCGYTGVRRRLERHVSIAGHEFHRIFINGGILVVVAAALTISVASNQPYRVRYMSLAEYYERQYLEMLSGPVTEDKKAYLEAETERLKRALDDNEREQKKALNSVKMRLSYLEENEGTYFVYDEPFGLLTAARGNHDDITFAVMFMVLIALSMPAFFAPEWQTGMRKVVSVTVHGKRKLVHVRYITGLMLTLVLLAITYLPPFVQTVASYGMKAEIFGYPVGSFPHLEAFGMMVSAGTYLAIIYILRFVAGVLAAMFIYKLSALVRSHIYTMATAFAVLLIPMLLACLDSALEPAVWPYSMALGNMFMQNRTAAVWCVVAVVLVSVAIKLLIRVRAKK